MTHDFCVDCINRLTHKDCFSVVCLSISTSICWPDLTGATCSHWSTLTYLGVDCTCFTVYVFIQVMTVSWMIKSNGFLLPDCMIRGYHFRSVCQSVCLSVHLLANFNLYKNLWHVQCSYLVLNEALPDSINIGHLVSFGFWPKVTGRRRQHVL